VDDNFIKFINNQFIDKSGVVENSLCFCGSEEVFLSCCKIKVNTWISDEYKKDFLGLAANKGYNVNKNDIAFILKLFEKHFFNEWDSCSNPYCGSKETINSHIFGKKHTEKYLVGSKCKIRNFYNKSEGHFIVVDTGKSITYKLFCKSCEQLFGKIDEPNHSVFADNNAFLHILRTQAYQYQFARMDLAFNHQFHLALQVPLEIDRKNFNGNTQAKIDLNAFIACYRRYVYQSSLRDKLWDFYNRRVDIPYLHKRVVRTKNEIFFASGIANPSHDLDKNKILFNNEASLFYFIVPESIDKLSVIIGSFDQEYKDMIDQFESLNDFVFKSYINHLCTSLHLSLSAVFTSSFVPTKSVLKELTDKIQLAFEARPFKSSDLESRKIFAKFIK
jgi:hypothetical protein